MAEGHLQKFLARQSAKIRLNQRPPYAWAGRAVDGGGSELPGAERSQVQAIGS
jgi:hypothetical protein